MAEADDRKSIEFAKCAADVAYFTHNYGEIDDAQGHGEGGGTMPFKLWPAQVRVLWSFLTSRLVLILKARQLGISWLCCSYALWMCVFNAGKVVLCFSKGQSEADELIRRIKALYDRLPEWMLEALPRLLKSNTETLMWDNGSRIRSMPATKSAGRSLTASLVILDEAAFLTWANEIYTALKPTIDGGGQLIILSTANGLGNLFHQLWVKAASGKNRFNAIFLPWWSRPGRDAAWYKAQKEEYTDPNMVKQEYPASANEAFIASGRARFDATWIEAQQENIKQPISTISSSLPSCLLGLPNLSVYKHREKDRRYIIGADVAEGTENGDYSTAVVIDAVSWEEMAEINGHWEPDTFADYLVALSDAYPDQDDEPAKIAPERNNHGHAVIAALKLKGYLVRVALGLDGKRGWLTNAQSKPQMIDLLAEALRDGLCKVRTEAGLTEMQLYAVGKDGDTNAPSGYHDDRVMAWSIALMTARSRRVFDDAW